MPIHLSATLKILSDFCTKDEIEALLNSDAKTDIRYLKAAKYDNLFRKKELATCKDVLNAIYSLDAYIAIAKAVDDHGFCFAEYSAAAAPAINITGLYHPCIKNAVKNDVLTEADRNICFLTGANMAGKSSYLKALGLAVYLAHVGFPVPATQMTTTIFKGLITTINLSDNINSGYSHYFGEVKRLKTVAEKIAEKDNLFVIFDELFKGTNVKDAYDASLATIKALSQIKHSVFLISTHIVEIATALNGVKNISFKYFDSKIKDGKPVFDFKLIDGVSSETLGYFIFKNEGILQTLKEAAAKQK